MSSIDICKIVYESVEPELPDSDTEFNQVMRRLRPLVCAEVFDQLESAVGLRISAAQAAAFRAGWTLRGRV